MNRKAIAILLLVLAIGVVGYWASTGAHIYDVEKVQVQEEKVDPIFGEKTIETTWKDEFHPGLLGYYIAPAIALLVLGAGYLFWSGRKGNERRVAM